MALVNMFISCGKTLDYGEHKVQRRLLDGLRSISFKRAYIGRKKRKGGANELSALKLVANGLLDTLAIIVLPRVDISGRILDIRMGGIIIEKIYSLTGNKDKLALHGRRGNHLETSLSVQLVPAIELAGENSQKYP
jgi:hypothetical protein